MSSPIADLRSIVQEHESEHLTLSIAHCNCMERIGYIMQVFYPEGIEDVFFGGEEDDDEGTGMAYTGRGLIGE